MESVELMIGSGGSSVARRPPSFVGPSLDSMATAVSTQECPPTTHLDREIVASQMLRQDSEKGHLTCDCRSLDDNFTFGWPTHAAVDLAEDFRFRIPCGRMSRLRWDSCDDLSLHAKHCLTKRNPERIPCRLRSLPTCSLFCLRANLELQARVGLSLRHPTDSKNHCSLPMVRSIFQLLFSACIRYIGLHPRIPTADDRGLRLLCLCFCTISLLLLLAQLLDCTCILQGHGSFVQKRCGVFSMWSFKGPIINA
ncbi:hypothetical protein BJ546DRAFT_109573 [Cryomyces antarcticus]